MEILLVKKSLLDYASNSSLPFHKTGRLVKELQLQIEARYMITSNMNTSDGLVNGSTGFLMKVDCGLPKNGTVSDNSSSSKPLRVLLKMEDGRSGKKKKLSSKDIS